MAWQQNSWSQPLNNFQIPGPAQSQMGPFNPMQFNPAMTPEQHYAMQQQNWQQWQTYQQQYAQWQATYGEKYQQEMQQKFGQNSAVMPPVMPQIGVSSMSAMSHLPPPLPNAPPLAPLPPPPPENDQQAINNKSNDPLTQRSFQATSATGSIIRTSNYSSQPPPISQQQFNNRNSQNANPFTTHPVRNQFDSPTANTPATNEFVTKPSNPVVEDVTDKTPEEKAFDEQFKKWEEEFTKWKLQNANHPDTRAYLEYEQKMEECRTKLLERREQMKRRKLELLQQKQQQQQPPPQITSIPMEQPRNVNEHKISGYSHSIGSSEKNDSMDRVVTGDAQPLMENVSNNQSQLFNRDSVSSSGIPGLDLVVDKPLTDIDDRNNDNDVHSETVVINDISPIREAKGPQQSSSTNVPSQRPDLEAISRGITSILGDPNLASLLSNFQPKPVPNPITKSAIPSLLDMQMPDIDLDTVPRFNWRDDDDDYDEEDDGQDSVPSTMHQQRQENEVALTNQSNENTLQDTNHLNPCDDDDDFDPDKEHERFAGMNYDNDCNDTDDRPFQMNRLNDDNYSKSMMNRRQGNFNRNSNFMNDNEPDDDFNRNRSNFTNDNASMDNFNRNRGMNNFSNDNFNENRSNFNENMRGNAGNFNMQQSFNFQGNRTNNQFDRSAFGNNSNFPNDRSEMVNNRNNFQQQNSSSNFNGGNKNFGNNFNQSMANDQFNSEKNNDFSARNDDDSNNMNDFCRRRNFQDFDCPNVDNSNSQFPSNYRNNSRSGDNFFNQNNSQPFNNVQNRGLPTDSMISDNAKDEDFFRPTKIIDYSANSKNSPTSIVTTNDEILKPTKVVDYGHQTMGERMGIVSRPQNPSHQRPVNKYTGGDFFPAKTIDYNHSSNKHMIKEYYYSIVSKWDPSSTNTRSPVPSQFQSVSNKSVSSDVSGGGSSGNTEPIRQRNQAEPMRPRNTPKPKQLREITYEQLSGINTSTKHGKRLKRNLILERSTVNDYPIGHKFYPSVKFQLMNEESRKRPGLPTKRGKRKRKNGKTIPFNKAIPAALDDSQEDYEEILSNDEDSLEDFDMASDPCKTQRTNCDNAKPATITPSTPIRPVRQNVVLLEDLIYNPGRQRRPHKIVIIMRGPPGSGKTFLAKLIKDREAENGGVAVRLLSIDDYFKTEVDEIRKCPDTGKTLYMKKMVYEYEKDMEDTYMQYLMKSYKKTVVDGLFDFIIVDSISSTLRHYTDFYNFAKVYAFTPYTCEMEMDPDICFKRNIHQRTLQEIKSYCDNWSKTPEQYLKLDFESFIRDGGPFDVDD